MSASTLTSTSVRALVAVYVSVLLGVGSLQSQNYPVERQLTNAPHGHLLTNIGAWSPDSAWLAYDTRGSLDGSVFNGQTIQRVHVATGQVDTLYRSVHGAHCGVVTYHPFLDQVVFILGPEDPTENWQYGPSHRQGVIVDCNNPGFGAPLDARDLVPNFTRGALRGGTHVHTFSSDGKLVASTYEDALLDKLSSAPAPVPSHEKNLRGISISIMDVPVRVPMTHPRNHSGCSFTVLATKLTDNPTPGSDEIMRACEEGWIGVSGYVREDGTRQRYALAFQGTVMGRNGQPVVELFVLDLPEQIDQLMQAEGSITGTATTRPTPPTSCRQRRVTFTEDQSYPGIASQPRHWIRSTPDGSNLLFLARDPEGVVQLYCVSPNGGKIRQVTRDAHSVASAFSVSPDGSQAAYVSDGSIFTVDIASSRSTRLTKSTPQNPPRPEACLFSPDGSKIAFIRTIEGHNQIMVVDCR